MARLAAGGGGGADEEEGDDTRDLRDLRLKEGLAEGSPQDETGGGGGGSPPTSEPVTEGGGDPFPAPGESPTGGGAGPDAGDGGGGDGKADPRDIFDPYIDDTQAFFGRTATKGEIKLALRRHVIPQEADRLGISEDYFSITEDGGAIGLELSEEGRKVAAAADLGGRVDVDVAPSDVVRTEGGGYALTEDARRRANLRRQANLRRIAGVGGAQGRLSTEMLQQQVGQARADLITAASALRTRDPGSRPSQAELDAAAESIASQTGADVSAGDVRLSAAGDYVLTEEAQRRIARDELAGQIEEQTGVRLGRGDFRVVRGDDGAFYAELTGSGRRELRGDEFAAQSARIDLGGIPGVAPGTSLLVVKEALLGAQEDAVSEVEGQVEDLHFLRGLSLLSAPAYLAQGRLGDLPLLQGPPEVDEDSPGQEQAEAFLTSIATVPVFPLGAAASGIEGLEFGLEAADVAATEGLSSELVAGETAAGMPTLRFEDGGAVGFAAGEAVETGGAAVEELEEAASTPRGRAALAGSLVGSAAIMGGAALAGPRLGLASRAAIQPGEELLGYGGAAAFRGAGRGLRGAALRLPGEGFAVTRPLLRSAAGRLERGGELLFPGNEPLLMSEEFFLMAGRRAGRRAGAAGRTWLRISRGEFDLADVPASPRLELLERHRPGGPTSELGAETLQAAGPSEPLGSLPPELLGAGAGVEARTVSEGDVLDVFAELERRTRHVSMPESGAELDRMAEALKEAAEDRAEFEELAERLGVDPVDLGDAMADGGLVIRHGDGPDLAMRELSLGAQFETFEAGMLERPGALRGIAEEAGEVGEGVRPDPQDLAGTVVPRDLPGLMEPAIGLEASLESELDLVLEEERERQRRATARTAEAEGEAGRDLAPPKLELGVLGAQRPATRVAPKAIQARRQPVAEVPGLDLGLDLELDFDVDLDLETDVEAEPEIEAEPEPRTEQRPEPEVEVEAELRLPFEPEAEAEGARRPPGEEERDELDREPIGAGPGGLTGALDIGWLGETHLALAGVDPGRAARRTTQAELEAQAEELGSGLELLPTLTAEEEAALEDELSLFGIGAAGGPGPQADGGGWPDLGVGLDGEWGL